MKPPEIPSEFIEPYLADFMGRMVEFAGSAVLTEEEKAERNGIGWTIAEVKHWVKGLELFVSQYCGIHARMAMMNEMYKFIDTPDEEMLRVCKKILKGKYEEE